MKLTTTLLSGFLALASWAGGSEPVPSPEARAIAFLSGEVPLWPRENNCYSCHNNGDAVRALYTATVLGYDVPDEALSSTNAWLARPEGWDDNGGGGAFDDATLARVQFASALLSGLQADSIDDATALDKAAAIVAADQSDDGAWYLDASQSIGSPATYGMYLTTGTARRVLATADPAAFKEPIERAERWLREAEVKTVIDAAAVVLALAEAPGQDDPAARRQIRHCLDIIRRGRAPSGGWGPYLISAVEPFDTALVMLALSELLDAGGTAVTADERAQLEALVAEGREYLLRSQIEDGSWRETTRPAGQESYAQYISTTGWAALALLRTGPVAGSGSR